MKATTPNGYTYDVPEPFVNFASTVEHVRGSDRHVLAGVLLRLQDALEDAESERDAMSRELVAAHERALEQGTRISAAEDVIDRMSARLRAITDLVQPGDSAGQAEILAGAIRAVLTA